MTSGRQPRSHQRRGREWPARSARPGRSPPRRGKSLKERMITKDETLMRWSRFAGADVAASLTAAPSVRAQVRAQPPSYSAQGSATPAVQAAPQMQLPPLPAATPITPNGTVVEDVIARVNDQIITRSEYDRARQQLMQEAR